MLSTMVPASSSDRDAYVRAMGQVATGVSIVSTDGPAGRFAMTVSAFSSVSADPPIVLACINRKSPLATAIRGNGVFCINVLGADQAGIADRFAGRPRHGRAYDFSAANWRGDEARPPRLGDAVAAFDCDLDNAVDQGSHLVIFGRVVAVHGGDDNHALVYARRTYGRPAAIAAE